MDLHPSEINAVMSTMTVLIDTREQNTPQARKRWLDLGVEHERQKLDFGDYSAKVLIDGEWRSYAGLLAIERKMSLDELAMCYSSQRSRFEREFQRAQVAGAKMYIVCENASWESAYGGKYRSQMSSSALTASIHAWAARYGVTVYFCKPETTGRLIRDILYREIKEDITNGAYQRDEQ